MESGKGVLVETHASKKKSRAMVKKKSTQDHCLRRAGQGRVCQRWKCEHLQEWKSERICDQVLVAPES